jgi:hypothetical protein
MDDFAKVANSLFVWVFVLTIIAVVVGRGHADQLITNVGKLIADLISIILSPQSGGQGTK